MSFTTIFLSLVLAMHLLGAARAFGSAYTLEDLEALERSSNFEEFFAHAKDIRPSQRGTLWKKMVASMADRYIEELSSSIKLKDEQFERVTKISSWSSLREDEFYAKKRNKFALFYLAQCLKQRELENCFSKAASFFQAFEKEEVLGVSLAQTLYPAVIAAKKEKAFETGQNPYDIWPFVAPMAQSAYGEFYCSKGSIYTIVADKLTSEQDAELVHKDCLKVMLPRLKQELDSYNGFKRHQAYLLLQKTGQLEERQKTKYLVVQLLSGFPFPQERWDSVLGSLKSLAEDQKLREELLEGLKKLDTLPDKIFAWPERKKALVIAKQIAQNFPEYVNFYATQCLKWLNGEAQFVKGNPTPNCHRYFELSKVVKSSPAPVVQKYQNIMNDWKKL